MSEHLTENEIERYASRSLGPADLLKVDEHLTTCADCRQKALTQSGLQASLAGIRSSMKPSDPADIDHPEPEQLAGYVDNTLGPVDREIVEGHLEICENCAAEVAELRSFRSVLSLRADQTYTPALAAGRFQRLETGAARRPAFRFAPAFAMAATLLIAAAVVWQVERGHHAPGRQVAQVTEPAPVVETPTLPVNPPASTGKPAPSVTPPTSTEKPAPSVAPTAPTPTPEASTKNVPTSGKTEAVSVPKPATASTHESANGPEHATFGNAETVTAQRRQEAGAPKPSEKRVVAPAPPALPSGYYTAPSSEPAAPPAAAKSAPVQLHPEDMMAMSAPGEHASGAMGARTASKAAALPDSVRRVIASGHLDLNTPEIRDLIGSAVSTDNIGASTATFAVTSPISTAILTDRPAFTWEQAKDATGYQVTIWDASGNSLAESPVVASTSWKAEKPMPRGQVLRWQVKAMENGSALRTAPDGGARFRILDADRVGQIRDAEKTFADQPMALGILYAQAGMLDEAERAFTKARQQDPQNEIVPKLMADLKAVRNTGL